MTRLVAALTFCLTLLPTAVGAATGAPAAASTLMSPWRTQDVCTTEAAPCTVTQHLVPSLRCSACQVAASTMQPTPQMVDVASQIVTRVHERLCDLLRWLPLAGGDSSCASPPAGDGALAHR